MVKVSRFTIAITINTNMATAQNPGFLMDICKNERPKIIFIEMFAYPILVVLGYQKLVITSIITVAITVTSIITIIVIIVLQDSVVHHGHPLTTTKPGSGHGHSWLQQHLLQILVKGHGNPRSGAIPNNGDVSCGNMIISSREGNLGGQLEADQRFKMFQGL